MFANTGAGPSLIGQLPAVQPPTRYIGGVAPPGIFNPPGYVGGAGPPITGPAGPPSAPTPSGADYYTQLLANDQQLQAILAGINAQQAAYQGQMTTAEQQALEQFGEIPAGLAAQYQALINPTVTGLAQQATAGGVSTVAQLQKALHDAQTASLDSLAARGLLHSGAVGQHENENLQGYNVGHYNALQSLLAGLGQNYNTYLGQTDTLQQQSQQATNDALNRIYQQIQAGLIPAPGASGAAAGGGNTPAGGGGGQGAAPYKAPNPSTTGLGTGGQLSNPAVNPNGYQPATAPSAAPITSPTRSPLTSLLHPLGSLGAVAA